MRTIILTLIISGICCAQGIPGGTIDGKPIPERVFRSPNACAALHGVIRDQAREAVLRDMSLTVTEKDISELRKRHSSPDPVAESNRIRQHAQIMIEALTAVDRGQDPRVVYTTSLTPQNVSQAEWDSYQTQWKNPAQRAQIQSRLSITPDAVTQGVAKAEQQTALYEKLLKAVDQELAAQDSQFRTALEHWNASERINPDHSVSHGILQVEKDYLETQREAYWKAREAKLHVVLNDPALAASCNLAAK